LRRHAVVAGLGDRPAAKSGMGRLFGHGIALSASETSLAGVMEDDG
jgi:hypothetical protein